MTIQTEIERICNETLSGILDWELIEGGYCTYQLVNSDREYRLQCCEPTYIFWVDNIVISIPYPLLCMLVETIKRKHQEKKESETLKILQDIHGKNISNTSLKYR